MVSVEEYSEKDAHCGPKQIAKSTFEGGPDGNISQCQGMPDQEGPQRESLVQFSQCHSQTSVATQTLGTKLQPVVHLQIYIHIRQYKG